MRNRLSAALSAAAARNGDHVDGAQTNPIRGRGDEKERGTHAADDDSEAPFGDGRSGDATDQCVRGAGGNARIHLLMFQTIGADQSPATNSVNEFGSNSPAPTLRYARCQNKCGGKVKRPPHITALHRVSTRWKQSKSGNALARREAIEKNRHQRHRDMMKTSTRLPPVAGWFVAPASRWMSIMSCPPPMLIRFFSTISLEGIAHVFAAAMAFLDESYQFPSP